MGIPLAMLGYQLFATDVPYFSALIHLIQKGVAIIWPYPGSDGLPELKSIGLIHNRALIDLQRLPANAGARCATVQDALLWCAAPSPRVWPALHDNRHSPGHGLPETSSWAGTSVLSHNYRSAGANVTSALKVPSML
jgi:hypothetical protein